MAEEKKDPKEILREARQRLIEGSRTKVRYGRATLTVRRSVVILGAPLANALKAHRRQAASAEDVAWRFLRDQTIDHSPTFKWETAKLDKLLPRVTAVVREPELKAQTPEELVAELERIETEQKEARKRISEQIRQFAGTPEYLRIMRRSQADLALIARQNRMFTQHQETLRKMTEPLRIQESLVGAQRKQLEQIQKALQPTIALESLGLGFSQPKLRELLGLDLPKRIAELTSFKNPFLEQDWRPVLERVAEAAREAEAPEIAEAVEVTASEAEKDKADVDFEAMRKAIEGLSEQLEESNRLAAEHENILVEAAGIEDPGHLQIDSAHPHLLSFAHGQLVGNRAARIDDVRLAILQAVPFIFANHFGNF